MNKYLTKLKNNNKNYSENTLNVRYNIESYGCGDGYKSGLKHRFYSKDKLDVILLIDIIRRFRLGTVITNITENSFKFENTTERKQIFCFRICRFVRTTNIRKILENIILINKSGVRIQNAFILGHYYTHVDSLHNNIPYYYGSRDILYCPRTNSSGKEFNSLNKPYKTLKECISNIDLEGMPYSSIFQASTVDLIEEKTELFNILKTKDFKKAEKYLLKLWYLK
jgi:hypothetical protein